MIFEFGAYARANNDTSKTVWDNLTIETEGGAAFAPRSSSVRLGGTSPEIIVRIPSGLNSSAAVNLRVVSANPSIATPDGGTGGTLNLTFPVGGPNTKTFRVRGVSLGGTTFSIEGDVGSPNPLSVAVILAQVRNSKTPSPEQSIRQNGKNHRRASKRPEWAPTL